MPAQSSAALLSGSCTCHGWPSCSSAAAACCASHLAIPSPHCVADQGAEFEMLQVQVDERFKVRLGKLR